MRVAYLLDRAGADRHRAGAFTRALTTVTNTDPALLRSLAETGRLTELEGIGSTIAAVSIVNSIKVRTAELLVERGAMPPVITRASVVGAERSRVLFDEAYREHARRVARAIGGGAPDGRANPPQEVKTTDT